MPDRDGTWTTGLATLHPAWTIVGRWPGESVDELVIGRRLAERLGRRVGDTVLVEVEGRSRRLKVVGVVTAGGLDDARAWAPIVVVQALSARGGQTDRIWVSALVKPGPAAPAPDPARDPAGYERYMCTPYPHNVARDLAQQIPGAEVLPLAEIVAGEGQVVSRLNLLLLLLALAALAAAALGLVATTTATVVERRAEIGLLRTLGATSRQLTALLLGETALISVAGGVVGWLLGSLAAVAMRGHTFGGSNLVEPLLLPLALALSFGVACLGTLGPMRIALRLDPATVLRG